VVVIGDDKKSRQSEPSVGFGPNGVLTTVLAGMKKVRRFRKAADLASWIRVLKDRT
jgi:hypothetical protein